MHAGCEKLAQGFYRVRMNSAFLMARGVYVMCYPTLSNGPIVCKPTRRSREIEFIGLREETGDLVPVVYTVWHEPLFFFLSVLIPSMHADKPPHHSAHLALLAFAKFSSTCGQGVAGSMPAHSWAPNLLSVTRQ